ncbi:hypothetical protein [Streptomyces hiroshimensis]|uniref:Uncharacterized protein n=1 Tax=Streptomyces hiroshimensis TaxID=66424 RepID=A0ABQ2Z9U4_9ACTN|nr:hypothetical protein [Streptomyces hiroshimensis]GGY05768.1 hypothetical protein GCM10010324_60770 [Streptomyces hiroshimensis]
MTIDVRTAKTSWSTGRQRWLRGLRGLYRPGRVTMVWALVYSGFGLVCAVNRVPLFGSDGQAWASASGWAVTVVGLLAAFTCAAVARYGLRPALRALLWAACGLAGLAAFGLLMDVITLMVGQGVDSRPSAANHALAAAGALLLASTARTGRRLPAGACAPAPSAAPRPVLLAACAGTAAFLPYVVMKLIWVTGGTFAGVSGAQMRAVSERNGASGIWLTLESWGLDVTVLLAALGIFLLWGLVRPWGQVFPRWTLFLRGRRVPRWLPLAPALIGAATLAPYGVIGLGYTALATAGVVTMRSGDFPSPDDAILASWIGMAAFAVYGLALAVAARSYWDRTRSRPAAR